MVIDHVSHGEALGFASKLDDLRAKYKIEIHFGPKRTTAGPNVAAVSFFESGKQLNGNGDELLYLCMEKDSGLDLNVLNPHDTPIVKGGGGCGSFITGGHILNGVAKCENCGNLLKAEALTSTIFVNMTTPKLATYLRVWFSRLKDSADIYLKYHPSDIRVKIMEDAYGLDKARNLRGLTIYPLKNILTDTSNGASLEGRFEALLRS